MNVNRISQRTDTRTAVVRTAARFLVWAALCVAALHSPAVTAQVSQTIGTLANGESVTVTFDVTIDSPLAVGTTHISVQGTVTYNGGTTVNTDDPETVAANDATVTELNQLVADQPPVAGPDFLQTDQDQSASLPEVKLLANDSDADGDALSISAVTTPTAQGGSVVLSGSDVLYTPPAGYSGSDSFTYTLSDGRGQTALGTVTVTVRNPNDAGNNPARIQNLGGGNFGIQFSGIPSLSYQVQYAGAVTGPWTDFGSPITATASGAVATTDASPQASTRFYRIVSAP